MSQYVSVWTTSDESSETVPSAERELILAKLLVEEMKELGIEDARVDEKGYVYGFIPATPGLFRMLHRSVGEQMVRD